MDKDRQSGLTKKEIIASYNEIHSKTDKLLEMASFYDWILDKLGVEAGKTLLDVAMGSGSLLKSAEARNLHVTGVDISISALKKSISILSQKRLLVGDGEKLPFKDGSFNYVTNIGSLEHFLNLGDGLNELRRVLRAGGKAAIFLPNSYYLGDIIWNVVLRGYGPSHNQVIDRFATVNEWADLIKASGMQVSKIYRYNFLFPRTKSDWQYIMNRPIRILGLLLSPFIPFNLSYSFLYICEKI